MAFEALTDLCTGCDDNKGIVLKAGLMGDMFTILDIRIAPQADRYGNRLSVWNAIFNEMSLQIAMLNLMNCLLTQSSGDLHEQICDGFDEAVIVGLMNTLVDPVNPVVSLQRLNSAVASSETEYGTPGYQRADEVFSTLELAQHVQKKDQVSTVCRRKYDPLRLHLCRSCFMLLCTIRDLKAVSDPEACRLVEGLSTYRFFAEAMGRIEINVSPAQATEQILHRVYFPIPLLPAMEIKNMALAWVYESVCENIIDDQDDHKKKMTLLFSALAICQVGR